MYQVVLGYIPLPVTPSSITTTINGQNETVDLIDGSQINIIKSPALKEISFDFMIPHQSYPFASLAGSAVNAVGDALGSIGGSLVSAGGATAILLELERMMKAKKPFYLIVVRLGQGLNMIHANPSDCFVKVTLENYTVTEDADSHGLDIMVSVTLKEYKDYGTAKINEDGSIERYFVK